MRQPIQQNKQASWWRPGLVLFSRLSGWIGGPIILALFIGKWLDRHYHTDPWLFLASVSVAFILSSAGIVWEANKAIKEMKWDAEKKEKRKTKKTAD
jgi:F0F1-type ATP synthase assembly protein I